MGIAYTPDVSDIHDGVIVVTAYTVGTPGNLDDIYNADLAGTLEVWEWEFTGTHATAETLDQPLQLGDYRSVTLEASCDDLSGTSYVQITGTDAMGGAMVRLVTLTVDATYVEFAHAFATITKIETAGAIVNPSYVRMRQKRWGICHKIDCSVDSGEDTSMYRLECPVEFGDGSTETHFKDTHKTVFFYDKYLVENNATLTWGDTATVGGGTVYINGCRINISRESNLTSYQHIKNGGIEYIYDTYFYFEPGDWATANGSLVYIYNSTMAGDQYSDSNTDLRFPSEVLMQRVNVHSMDRLLFAGATTLSDIFSYGNNQNIVAEGFQEVWVLSSKTESANSAEIYAAKSSGLKFPGRFHIVNTTFDPDEAGLQNVLCYIWVHYSVIITVTDTSGSAIVGAMVSIVNKTTQGEVAAGSEFCIIERSGQILDGGHAYNAYDFTLDSVTGLNIGDDIRMKETIHAITDITGLVVEVNSGSPPTSGVRDTPVPQDKTGDDFPDEEQVYHFFPIATDADGKIDCSGKRSLYIQWTNSTATPPVWSEYNPYYVRIYEYGYQPYKVEKEILKSIDEGVVLVDNAFITESTYATVRAYPEITIDHDAESITITDDTTTARIYDFCQSELKAQSVLGVQVDDFYYTSDGINYETTYSFTVNTTKTVTFTDKKLTCDSYTLTGTAIFTGIITDGTDIQVPVSLTSVIDGSVYGVYVTADESEIMAGTISGTSITTYYEHTAGSPVGITIRVRNATEGPSGTDYLPYLATSSIGDDVFNFKVEQQLDPITN